MPTDNQQEPQAAAAIVNANIPIVRSDLAHDASTSQPQQSQQQRPSSVRRHWSSEQAGLPKFDKLGRRILINSPNMSRPSSNTNSIPGTPRRGDSDVRCTQIRAKAFLAFFGCNL